MTLLGDWSDLDRRAPEASGHLRKRVSVQSPVDVFMAVAAPAGARALVVGFPGDPDLRPLRRLRLRGLDVAAAPFSLGESRSSVAISTRSSAFNDLFARLAEDLVAAIAGRATEKDVVDALVARLKHWQRFLERFTPEGLSVEEQASLFGELWFLSGYLVPALGAQAAVLSWQGPLDGIQDFQTSDWAVEVKTTRQAAPASVRIANERQLQSDGLALLALVIVALEQRSEGSPSLVDMVVSVRELVAADPVAAMQLEDRLLSAGYSDEHRDLYVPNAFAIRWTMCSLVSDEFPRLTEHDLPPGVGDVIYHVTIDACRQHEVEFGYLTPYLVGNRT